MSIVGETETVSSDVTLEDLTRRRAKRARKRVV